ncbi:NUDIX hydrolase [Amycolatopsis kentuckyensis]|uniref:NUDIX hydrolase n=1 Tax=Amycolatopsis kentuckyensis TaxID=218823 RepID=UPI000A39726D|nr:NUDIX domain-containing protein [Amycolatopsis kentuckyensis]
MPSRAHTIVDVHLLFIHDGQLLLTRRKGGYGDGMWHLPSGHLEPGESLVDAAAREAAEEVGLRLNTSDLTLVHSVHVRDSGPEPRLGFFFAVNAWHGEPTNLEPEKCDAVTWFPLDALPERIIDYPGAGIAGYLSGTSLSIVGWGSGNPNGAEPTDQSAVLSIK